MGRTEHSAIFGSLRVLDLDFDVLPFFFPVPVRCLGQQSDLRWYFVLWALGEVFDPTTMWVS